MQRSITSLIVGIVLGVAAVVLMALYLRSARPAVDASQAMGNIVVAAVDMPIGTEIKPEFVKIVQWPVVSIPKDAFVASDEIFKGAAQPGDRVSLKIVKVGEPILKTNVSGFGGRATMSREVARGMRAVAIRIDDVSGVAGFILPGDRVDVMLTRQVDTSSGPGGSNLGTDVILQNITVLGVDQLADQDRDKPLVGRTVTVEVTPDQAQKLALAQQAGSLGLALRNAETLDKAPISRVRVPDLYGEAKAPKPVHHVAAAGPSVRVRYGDEGVVEKTIP